MKSELYILLLLFFCLFILHIFFFYCHVFYFLYVRRLPVSIQEVQSNLAIVKCINPTDPFTIAIISL